MDSSKTNHGWKRLLVGLTLAVMATLPFGCSKSQKSEPAAEGAASTGGNSIAAAGDSGADAASRPQPGGEGSEASETVESTPPPSTQTPEEILQAMVDAYRKANSYADNGKIIIRGWFNDQPVQSQMEYVTAWERPNRLRLICYEGSLVCNGEQFWATVRTLPNQVLRLPAPAEWTLTALMQDTVLANGLMQGPTQGFSLVPPPLVLLLAEDPLKTLLYQAGPPELLPPGTLGSFTCDRVRVTRPDGNAVFWIDRQDHLLVRLEYPVEQIRRAMGAGQIRDFVIYAEFVGAGLNVTIDPAAFKFESPSDARIVDELRPHGYQYLGKQPEPFEFVDAQGETLNLQRLAGKPAVLEFWAKNDPYSQYPLKQIQTLLADYRDRVQFWAVSVDHVTEGLDSRAVSNEELQDLLKSWQVELPLARDPKNDAERCFSAVYRPQGGTVPAMAVLGPDGTVQTYHLGSVQDLAERLGATLDKILSGVDLAQEEKNSFKKMKDELGRLIKEAESNGLYTFPVEEIVGKASVKAAPFSQPERHRLTQVFRCEALKSPGNLLVFDATGDAPNVADSRILVVEDANTATELGWDGQIVARYVLKPTPPDVVDFLRTAQDTAGNRLFAAWGMGGRQLLVFDGTFQPLLRFPPDDAPPHQGLADVRLLNLDGDDKMDLAVSYLGIGGVQGVSLEGKRLWGNRTVSVAFRMSEVLSSDGSKTILVTNTGNGSAVQLNLEGERIREVVVPGRTITWLAAADLDGDGQSELCGLDVTDYGQIEAFGFDLEGRELWKYPLPRGMAEYPVEQITWAPLEGENERQWVLAAADGSVHVLDKTGTLVDRFNSGGALSGLAVGRKDGKPVVLIAHPNAVEAWWWEAAQ
ncbi:redoxin domain-containing protein [Thermopirellula anaerolimosa]